MSIPKHWGPALFLISYQAFWVLSFPFYLYYSSFSTLTWILAFILLYATGLSITAGYHRYFSHRAYKTNSWVEAVLLFFGSMAAEGSALRWCYDHRNHHAEVDSETDPYSIKKGFLYAHCFWLFDPPRPIDPKVVPDLLKKRSIQFQDRWYLTTMIGSNFIAFCVVGWITQDYLGAFFVATLGRMFLLHHFTWFINSLAHTWGDKPFSQELSAVDNYFLSLLTFGEGYHNYHHTFANDYRNGIRWFHFDPTKWLIFAMSKLGLAKNLRRTDSLTIEKKIFLERKTETLEKLKALWHGQREALEAQVQLISDKLTAHFSECFHLREQLKAAKDEKSRQLALEFKKMRQKIREDWEEWTRLCQGIDALAKHQSRFLLT